MLEQYYYPRLRIIFPYSLLLIPVIIMSAGGIYGWLDGRHHSDGSGILLDIFFLSFMLFSPIAIIVWIVNSLSVKIVVDDAGISFNSLLRKCTIHWENIADVKQKILYERSRYKTASDLLIKDIDGNNIKIFGVVRRCDGSDAGIKDLEKFIRDKTSGIKSNT